ncbi:unnamed protein product [Paramecium sonneborni]|uniref:Uncharacterized protein n=1 Tax=Paramecium sonneborni TaxID=65129 RepID=A0A8S1PBU3_9CILI|nr:unnamed protein product [Paramecium sonneborni]CAD8100606.1 unnamed protein product [Paramecium sonneborni]
MNSPLSEFKEIQLRQIEHRYYQKDTEQIKQILNSIKMIAFENTYKKQLQQPIKLNENIKCQDDNEIVQFYRNQYKSIDIVERSNLRSRIINKKLIEYQNRNTPKNLKMGFTSTKNSENVGQFLNKVKKPLVVSNTERISFDKTKTILNKTMQQTFNDFTQKWIKNEILYSPSKSMNEEKLKRGKSIFFDEITNRAQQIVKSATTDKKEQYNSYNAYTKNKIKEMSSIQLGNLSFQVQKKCNNNNIVFEQELRLIKNKIAKRVKPNILIVDQKRIEL